MTEEPHAHVPTQVATLPWLLGDRRIRGPGVAELLPSGSYRSDTAPYTDPHPAAGPGPDRVPAGPTEPAWVSSRRGDASGEQVWSYLSVLLFEGSRQTQDAADLRP